MIFKKFVNKMRKNKVRLRRDRFFNIKSKFGNSKPFLVEETSGEEVIELQEMLQQVSNNFPSLPIPIIDGYYGKETKDIVKKFQSLNSLPETGMVDNMTWDKIKEFVNRK